MSKNITTRIAAGAAAAGLAAAMVAVGGGAASAAPITGSADAVADFVTGLGLAQVATYDNLEPLTIDFFPQADGNMKMKTQNNNDPSSGYVECSVAVYPALEAPADGVPAGPAVWPTKAEDGRVVTGGEKETGRLAPGVYAVSSACSLWESAESFGKGDKPKGSAANQPHYFVTLGGLL